MIDWLVCHSLQSKRYKRLAGAIKAGTPCSWNILSVDFESFCILKHTAKCGRFALSEKPPQTNINMKHARTHTHWTRRSLYDPAGTESCDMHIRLVTKIRMSIYIWDYGDHQLRLTIAPRCVTTVPRVRLHGSPGGVFVGHRPPRDPGDPPLIYVY